MSSVEREMRCFGDFYVRSKPIAQSLHDLADVGGFLPGAYQGALSAASYRNAWRLLAFCQARVTVGAVAHIAPLGRGKQDVGASKRAL
jgi:hypothetical protein